MADPTPPRLETGKADGFGAGAAPTPRPGSGTTVAPGNGYAWWTEGWRLFAATPWVWIAITLVFVAIMVLLSLVPLLGTFATTLLAPVLAGGVIVGCRALDRGGELTINHLFLGFNDRLGPLIVVGVLYLAGSVLIMLVVLAILAATVGMAGVGALLAGDAMNAGWAALATVGFGALLACAAGLLVAVPLMMAYWFAPALVMLRNDEPLAAMKSSFDACLRNMLPMLVYSLIGLVLAIVASIPLGLGWLVLAPVFAASVYASYKDIFEYGSAT